MSDLTTEQIENLVAMGTGEEDFGEDRVDEITGTPYFRVGPRVYDDGKDKCTVYVTFQTDDDDPQDDHTAPYNVGPLIGAGERSARGKMPNQFIPGYLNESGQLVPCDLKSEDEKDHVGTHILCLPGDSTRKDRPPTIHPRTSWAKLIASFVDAGKDPHDFDKDLSKVSGTMRVEARAVEQTFKQDGEEQSYSVLLIHEVLKSTGRKSKAGAAEDDLSPDELEEFGSVLSDFLDEAGDDTVTVGKLTGVVMKHCSDDDDSGNRSGRWIAATRNPETLRKVGIIKQGKNISRA